MKLFSLSLLVFVAILAFQACEKDPPTLSEKVEGHWRVFNYEYYLPSILPPDDNIRDAIDFKDEGGNKGTIWWTEYREIENSRDTAVGSYLLNESTKILHINWQKVDIAFGVIKCRSVGINLSNDTLSLFYPDTFHIYLNGPIIQEKAQAVPD